MRYRFLLYNYKILDRKSQEKLPESEAVSGAPGTSSRLLCSFVEVVGWGQNQEHFRASLELVPGKTQSWGGTSLLLKTGLKPV